MNLKTTATIVTTSGALAAWLVGAVTTNHTITPAPVDARMPSRAVEERGAALATEIGRRHDRLRPTTMPREPGRNLFRFHSAPAAPGAPVAPPAVAPIAAPPPEPQAPTMRLVGIAEDPGPDGPKRV